MLIRGTTAAELLKGTASADTIIGAGGSDTVDGGAGLDTLSFGDVYYEKAASGLGVDLAAGTATFAYSNGTRFPIVETTVLTSIENATGSVGNDGLSGNAAANVLDGGAGDDMLDGRGGNDNLIGGLGNDTFVSGAGQDTLDGGAGGDTVFYQSVTAAAGASRVVIDLSAGKAWTSDGTDTLIGIESVTASSSNDWIKGNDASNTIDAGLGDDIVIGVSAAGQPGDVLVGASGNDGLYGGAGNDTISGDEGIDWLDGGAGDDWLSDGGSIVGEWSAMHGGAGNDTLGAHGWGSLGIWGGDGNDTIQFFNHGTEYVNGGAGADTYEVYDNMLSGDAGLVQIFDFKVGEDKLVSQIYDKSNVVTEVHDWGAHTGITFHDTVTGNTGTVMLMGVASSTLVAEHDLVLT